jgi:pSer/pThr/pTyr-binding forkhead associated (FHA) protein
MADGAIEVKLSLKGRPIREFVFSEPRVMIGRDPQSHIVLDNPGISRCHAELVREEDGFYINDQESANGTFLNDVPVTRSHLKDGDRIRIGKFLLVLRIGAERRVASPDGQQTAFPESTMVLEPAQVDRLMKQTKQAEQEAALRRPSPETERPTPASEPARRSATTEPARRSATTEPARRSATTELAPRPGTTEPARNSATPEPVSIGNVLRAPETIVVKSPAPPLSIHRTSSNPEAGSRSAAVAAQTPRPASWVRAHIIALEVGFAAGLAVGILIAMTVLS